MGFIRVRDKRTGHEYDTTRGYVALTPEHFEVIDKEEVSQPRPAVHFVPKPDGEGTIKKPLGKTSKEN